MSPSIELCGYKVGPGQKLFVIAGPDSIESEEMALRHARSPNTQPAPK